jgi:hypothetical protein
MGEGVIAFDNMSTITLAEETTKIPQINVETLSHQYTWLNIRGIETLSHQYTWLNIRGIETLSHQYTWQNIRGIQLYNFNSNLYAMICYSNYHTMAFICIGIP